MSPQFRATETEPLAQLEEMRTMLAETVHEWTKDWVAQGREEGREEGREQGREQGRAEERRLLCRQAARKFDAGAAARLATALSDVADPEHLAQVGEWIIECETAADLMARVLDKTSAGH
jgi:flagellar biosynthesis/type III secretory pathway protein FliH